MDNFISPSFDYQGFKPAGQIDNFYIFRRKLDGKIQTVKATKNDLESGFIYKLIDNGLSRF